MATETTFPSARSRNFYTVVIVASGTPTVSRHLSTLRAARNWARWCAKKWETTLYRGQQGGERVEF